MLKHLLRTAKRFLCLITVQDNTMLKLVSSAMISPSRLITVQDNTMLKHKVLFNMRKFGLITVQDNTMLKRV